ncbi:hypothetical protein EV183_002665 [Coemansia sp. RSA 2336]|nr:hypothetical protein EV183_002665 [Coemansia sp. RSA 2336]
MDFSKLPSDIILLIIETVVAQQKIGFDISEWKSNLELLAVCQSWRCTGIPQLYRVCYIFSSSSTGSIYAEISTNLGLAVVGGYFPHIKTVVINTDWYVFLSADMNAILGRLSNIAAVWPRVNKLVLNCNYEFNGYGEVDQAEQEAIAVKLPERFVQLFPHVRKLFMDNETYYDVHKSMYVSLANRYLDQLQVLMHVRFAFNSQYFSQHINAESLVKLSMIDMPNTNFWLLFKNPFTNLRYLDYSYGNNWDASSESLQLQPRFPGLSMLQINCLHGQCPVLANGMFPDTIEKLDIRLSSETADLFKNMHLDKILPIYQRFRTWIAHCHLSI